MGDEHLSIHLDELEPLSSQKGQSQGSHLLGEAQLVGLEDIYTEQPPYTGHSQPKNASVRDTWVQPEP